MKRTPRRRRIVRRALCVDDNEQLVRAWGPELEAFCFELVTFTRLAPARAWLESVRSDHGLSCAIVDLVLPDGNGASLFPLIDDLYPQVPAIALSGYLTTGLMHELGRPKDCALLKSVTVIDELLMMLSRMCLSFADAYGLSPRENQLTEMATLAFTNRRIAGRLGISMKTVDTLWTRIFGKTGCCSKLDVATLRVQYDAEHGRLVPGYRDRLRARYGGADELVRVHTTG